MQRDRPRSSLVQHLPVQHNERTLQFAGDIISHPSKLRLNDKNLRPALLASVCLGGCSLRIGPVHPVESPFWRLRQKQQSKLLGALAEFDKVLASVFVCFWTNIRSHNRINISDKIVDNPLRVCSPLKGVFGSEETGSTGSPS